MPKTHSAQILASTSSRGYSGGSGSNSGNFFTRFLREEIFAQDKRQGNIDILVSIGVFGAAIAFIQNYAEELKGLNQRCLLYSMNKIKQNSS
ncbi:9342_t:CDS:2 [Funneliformis caledonium]|uniref:9342_t:CDS:1 n=1 Tax=Funneliformis caledonium TaxID=1117310 RepID=A0A9N9B2F6_9GLOM|nr:9342_t:CDS:2 [Funneliformis caledonium]